MDYYLNSPIPLVKAKLGSALKSGSVERGLNGGMPGSPAIYTAMANLLIDSLESLQTSFGPHMKPILADVPTDTDIQPTKQISEVKL